MNLDKWKPEMVEMYKHFNNAVVNAYWEAKLPKGFQKPGQNANSREVEAFIRDKYVNKRYVDPKMGLDPATLYWQDRKKFDKFVKKVMSGEFEGDDSDEEPKHKKKSKKSKKRQDDSEESEGEKVVKALAEPLKAKIQPKVVPVGDLINLDAMPASVPSQPA